MKTKVVVEVDEIPGEHERARQLRAAAALLRGVFQTLDTKSAPCSCCKRDFADNVQHWLFARKLSELVNKIERWAVEWRTGEWTERRGHDHQSEVG